MDRSLLKKLEFHLERLVSGGTEHDWERVEAALAELLVQRPEGREAALARRLPGFLEHVRARLLPGDVVALQRDLALASRRDPQAPPPPSTPEQAAAALLRGRSLLVIGGDPRPEHQARLRNSLGLGAVHWARTREQRPDLAAIEPLVARADVAAVVLLIRWIRHALNDVSDLCALHGKPMARITAGYNPAQVALALLEQCAQRLEE